MQDHIFLLKVVFWWQCWILKNFYLKFISQVKTRHIIKGLKFSSFYGMKPPFIHFIFQAFHEKHPYISFKCVFKALTWLKLCKINPIMVQCWGLCKEHIVLEIKEYIELLQGLFEQNICFDKNHEVEVFKINIYVGRLHKDPRSEWIYFKNNGRAFTYENILALKFDLNMLTIKILPFFGRMTFICVETGLKHTQL